MRNEYLDKADLLIGTTGVIRSRQSQALPTDNAGSATSRGLVGRGTDLLRKVLQEHLAGMVQPQVSFLHRKRSSYKVCGYTGYGCAALLGVCLAWLTGLSPGIVLCLLPVSALSFFGLAMATKIIAGEEKIIYYHHEIAVLASASLALQLLGEPLLPYLDITVLGVGLFLGCGRVGCLMVGCCHGRPHGWGVRYGKEHVRAGFIPCYQGVRLFPLQAVESLWVFATVLVGCIMVLKGYPPGEALSWYVVAYGIGRFTFEFLRGDPARPYFLGFSEAQWTTVVLILAVAAAEGAGRLVSHAWHAATAALMVLTMIVMALARRSAATAARHRLLHPRHLREVAETVRALAEHHGREVPSGPPQGQAGKVSVGMTSLGLRLSAGVISSDSATHLCHYAFSLRDGILFEDAAKALARFIRRLQHPSGSFELLKGNGGVFHLLVRAP